MRSHRLVTVLSLTTLSVAAAACSSSSHPKAGGSTVPTTATTQAPTTSSTVPGSTGATTTATPTTSGGPPTCTTQSLKGSFSVIPGSASAGHLEARVVLTNSSSAACRTFGYVGMQLLDANGAPVPTNVVRQPGTVQQITLAPGQSASAVSQFSPDIPGQGDSTTGNCQPVAASTELTPPNDTRFIVVPGPGQPVCEKGTIDLRPLQPGASAGP